MKKNIKIVIVYSPDPIYINQFTYNLVKNYQSNICSVIETEGSIIRRKTIKNQIEYFLSLLLILGIKQTVLNSYTMVFKKNQIKSKIIEECKDKNIKYFNVRTINSKECIELLDEMNPDIVFNQSQHIIKKRVLETAKIGFVNRHGSFLPKYRGRLSPFWQLLNKEKSAGLTFHFIDEKIDNGKIICQYPINIERNENVSSLIKKMFDLALVKFEDVIHILSNEEYQDLLINNNENEATYYSSPRIKEAMRYRFGK